MLVFLRSSCLQARRCPVPWCGASTARWRTGFLWLPSAADTPSICIRRCNSRLFPLLLVVSLQGRYRHRLWSRQGLCRGGPCRVSMSRCAGVSLQRCPPSSSPSFQRHLVVADGIVRAWAGGKHRPQGPHAVCPSLLHPVDPHVVRVLVAFVLKGGRSKS